MGAWKPWLKANVTVLIPFFSGVAMDRRPRL
jgi:hypothetical protein